MIGVFGEHAAREVVQNRRQALTSGDCGEIAEFKLAIHDRSVVGTIHWQPAERQCHQQHAKRVHVVGDAAVATGCGMTEGGVGGLAYRGLVHGGRR